MREDGPYHVARIMNLNEIGLVRRTWQRHIGKPSRMPTPPLLQTNDRVTQHLGLVLGIGAVALTSVRVLSISWYDVGTALAVVQNGGAATIAIASLVTVVPVIMGAAAMGMAFAYMTTSQVGTGPRRIPGPLIFGLVLFLIMCAAVAPWYFVAFAVAMAVIGAMRHVWFNFGFQAHNEKVDVTVQDPQTRRAFTRATLVAVGATLVLMGVLPLPWLPVERVEYLTTSDETTRNLAVYVLKEDDTHLVVLFAGRVIRLQSSRISDRQVCRGPYDSLRRSPFALLLPPRYEECPIIWTPRYDFVSPP